VVLGLGRRAASEREWRAAGRNRALNSQARQLAGFIWPRGARTGGLWTPLALLVAALISLPVLVVTANLFTPAGAIWQHLAATVLPNYIENSLWILLGVGAGVLVVGVGTAWLVAMCDFPGRRAFEWGLLLPFAVPTYVIAYTYTALLDVSGPVQLWLRGLVGAQTVVSWFPDIRSLPGAIVLMALVLYPYVYMLARTAFLEQSHAAIEVSRTLGCGPWRSFGTVSLPLARPAIVGGLALALMEALNDFGTVQFFGVDTFTTGIYRTWLGLGERPAATQLAALLMLFIFALILLERWSRGMRRYQHTGARYQVLPRYRLRGSKAVAAWLACAAPVTLGFLIPAAALAIWAAGTADEAINRRFLTMAASSFLVATITAVLAVVLAATVAYGLRIRQTPTMTIAARIAALGYAVPGSVIAVGVLIPFAFIDNTVDAWMRAHFGLSTGLFLSGTLVALVFAYLVRFLAISLNTVEAGFGRITPRMDDAARSLGCSRGGVLRRVLAPLMRGSLMTAGLLVFVDVMKELPATLLVRPFNFTTLAVHAYEYASDELIVEASSASLAIVVVGIVPVILLSRAITRARAGQTNGPIT
jgi:iron(III) transport system permease protein